MNLYQLHQSLFYAPFFFRFKAKIKNDKNCYRLTITTKGIRDSVKYN